MKPKHYFDANLYARQLGFERVTRPPGSPGGDLLFFAMTPLRGALDAPMYNPEDAIRHAHNHNHGHRGLAAEPGSRTRPLSMRTRWALTFCAI